jgi:hypothetical protein
MNALRTIRSAAIALAAIGLFAFRGMAQAPDPVRADAVLQQAYAAEAQAARTGSIADSEEVARLHIQSANLRAYSDPQAITSLRTAAFYLSYSKPAQAAELLVIAAERALARGDIITAANSYLDAAAAVTEGQGYRVSPEQYNQVERWLMRAAMLAESPLLDSADREILMRRLAPIDIGNFAG